MELPLILLSALSQRFNDQVPSILSLKCLSVVSLPISVTHYCKLDLISPLES